MKRLITSSELDTLRKDTILKLIKIGSNSLWHDIPLAGTILKTSTVVSKQCAHVKLVVIHSDSHCLNSGFEFYATDSLYCIFPSYAQIYCRKKHKKKMKTAKKKIHITR